MKIPLTSTSTVFTVYRINSVPIILGPNREETSVMKFKKPFIAVSNDEMFYIRLSQSELDWCQGKMLKRCTQGLIMQEVDKPDCALAILQSKVKDISELCDFTLLPKSAKQTEIITIRPNTYLISTSETNWLKTCVGGTPTHVKACKLCTINVPCACSLKADTFFIPAMLDNCNFTKLPTQVPSHNLPALFAFYGQKGEMYNISQLARRNMKSDIAYPKISVLDKEFEDVIFIYLFIYY